MPERDQPGLRAVVQVALDAAQLGGLGVDGLGARLGQLLRPAARSRLFSDAASSARSMTACAARGEPRRQPPEDQVEEASDERDDRRAEPDGGVDEQPHARRAHAPGRTSERAEARISALPLGRRRYGDGIVRAEQSAGVAPPVDRPATRVTGDGHDERAGCRPRR